MAPGDTDWAERVSVAFRDAGLPDPTGGHLPPDVDALDDMLAPWLVQCGRCDAGLPEKCACPTGDVRPVLRQLAGALIAARCRVRGLQNALERERRDRAADELARQP